MQIRDLFNIQQRFLRSANLERDFRDPSCLNGYIVTKSVTDSLARINTGLGMASGLRSWRITGDFGSGKSSFALLLTQLYARREAELRGGLRRELVESLAIIKKSGVKFRPVLVTGSREPIAVALVRALSRSLDAPSGPGRKPRSFAKEQVLRLLAKPVLITDQAALDVISATHAELAQQNPEHGLLIIIDELGKFLEFAALHPERQDVFVLQQLAELATRSAGRNPMFVVGLLHQGFSAYADILSPSAQREWEKVAGRFEEVVFDQRLEQVVHLISAAMAISKDRLPRGVESHSKGAMRELVNSKWYGGAAPIGSLTNLAPHLYPLHPTVVPLLVKFFSRWGQNERSLFGFLLSNEPHSLQHFSKQTASCTKFYRLHNLFDYVAANFGHRLSSQSYRSHWNHIESLVRSFPADNATDIAVLKTIGLLNLINSPDLIPTEEIITLSVSEEGHADRSDVKNSLKRLHHDRHVLYFRGRQGGYCLWSHSSMNLDKVYEDASRTQMHGRRISAWVKDHLEVRPVVARRHYIKTGNLRSFEVKYCQPNELRAEAEAAARECDGRIIIPLCETAQEVQQAESYCRSVSGQADTIFGLTEPLASLEGLIHELERWTWVERNTPELKDDKYATEEVTRQLTLAKQTLDKRMQHYVGMRFATRRGEMPIRWFHGGRPCELKTGTAFLTFVSKTCDQLFPESPKVQNELINRRSISSQATLARTRLIERIFKNQTEKQLGMDPSKKPPEMAIYLSVLQAGNVHVCSRGRWRIGIPEKDSDPCNLRPSLERIGLLLHEAGNARVPILEIFKVLRAEPFGVRDGLLPLLLAIYLQTNWHRTALYEDGTYLHDVASFEFVRLMKEPEHFELQHCAVEGVKAEVFSSLVESLQLSTKEEAVPDLLDVVRPLAIFAAGLPDYSRRTRQLSATAVAIREALLEAREPSTLIFVALPKACGFLPFEDTFSGPKTARTQAVLDFATSMRHAVDELRNAYDRLIDRLEATVLDVFAAPGSLTQLRANLKGKCAAISSYVTDPNLKAFIFRLSDQSLPRRQWLESLASLIVTRPPERWADQDEIEFQHQLNVNADRFMRVEAIAFRSGGAVENACHIVMTRPDGSEVQHVFQWERHDGSTDSKVEQEIAALVAKHGRHGLAAAAKIVWSGLQPLETRKEKHNE